MTAALDLVPLVTLHPDGPVEMTVESASGVGAVTGDVAASRLDDRSVVDRKYRRDSL